MIYHISTIYYVRPEKDIVDTDLFADLEPLLRIISAIFITNTSACNSKEVIFSKENQ